MTLSQAELLDDDRLLLELDELSDDEDEDELELEELLDEDIPII